MKYRLKCMIGRCVPSHFELTLWLWLKTAEKWSTGTKQTNCRDFFLFDYFAKWYKQRKSINFFAITLSFTYIVFNGCSFVVLFEKKNEKRNCHFRSLAIQIVFLLICPSVIITHSKADCEKFSTFWLYMYWPWRSEIVFVCTDDDEWRSR